jgi:DHA2 family methylenomycin A resistance protein-like MFS transporter
MFWINLPIGLLALVGLLVAMPASARRAGRRIDLPGQVLFTAGGSAVTFVLIEGRSLGWLSTPVLALLAGGVLALAVFAWWETRAAEPMLPPRLLRIPAAVVASVVNFLGLFGLYAALYLVTTYLQGTEHIAPVPTGLRFLSLFGCMAVAAVSASAISGRFGTRRTMVAGLLCVTAGLVGLSLLERGVGYPGYGWALVLLGAGVPLSSGVVAIQAMMREVPAHLAGTASGTMNTFRQFGAVFGVALAGVLSPERAGRVTDLHVTFLVAAVGAALAAVPTAVVLRERVTPRPPAEPGPSDRSVPVGAKE